MLYRLRHRKSCVNEACSPFLVFKHSRIIGLTKGGSFTADAQKYKKHRQGKN